MAINDITLEVSHNLFLHKFYALIGISTEVRISNE